MPRTILFHSLRHLTPQSSPTAWVLVEGERLLAMGEGESWREQLTADQLASAQVREAGNWLLAPGFTDIHCHGGGGAAFEDAPDVAPALRVHGRGRPP